MSWIEGIEQENERYRRLLAQSRLHMVLQVPEGFSVEAHVERVAEVGGERIHVIVSGPDIHVPRE